MFRFIVRRLIVTVPMVLIVITLTWALIRLAPGNFYQNERPLPPAIEKNIRARYGLDKPWYVQYVNYVKGVATGDLGPSLVLRDRTVNDIVKEQFPNSIELGLYAFGWAVVLGVPAGMIAALRPNSRFDYGAMLFSNVGFALPNFLVATLLIYYVSLKWGILPTSGWTSWQHKLLPSFTLGLVPMAYFARLVRGTMLETLQADYVRTAKAKGLRWRRVVTVHVLRNSLIPVVTAAAPLLGYIITGSFIVENIFAVPGIGRYYVTAVSARDYSVVMGLTVLLSIIVIVANLVVDILYTVLDPRTREART